MFEARRRRRRRRRSTTALNCPEVVWRWSRHVQDLCECSGLDGYRVAAAVSSEVACSADNLTLHCVVFAALASYNADTFGLGEPEDATLDHLHYFKMTSDRGEAKTSRMGAMSEEIPEVG
jgi:hypothetical protein